MCFRVYITLMYIYIYRRVVRRLSAYRSAHTLSSAARAHRAEVKEEKKLRKA